MRSIRAHPRSRGENLISVSRAPSGRGSSPLTRGKPTDVGRQDQPQGLIPAHAGKTGDDCSVPVREGAHPRSRGENGHAWPPSRCVRGSSPLTRGKPTCLLVTSERRGLIPAHAGKTVKPRSMRAWLKAHPRSRGENPGAPRQWANNWGSSPLTRGKHNSDCHRVVICGLIPAHAGKT